MSILIRGMAMPKNCTCCPICCGLPYQHRDVKGRRPDCPLIELPPHGRLADLDKMINDFWDCDSMIIGNYELEKIEVVIEGSET